MNKLQLMYDIDANPEFVVVEEINEATGQTSKKYKIQGVFSTIGERNRNGRIYPRELWESEVTKYQDNFHSGSINTLMEWEHPARTNVDPMEAVAKITNLKIKDKYVIGEAVLLDNPKANQLKSLIDNGIKISVSSRGVGSVKNGIVENFKLVTYDIVSTPSDYNASMNGLVESYQLNEGVIEDLMFSIDDNGNIVSLMESDHNKYGQVFDKKVINNAVLERFNNLLTEMSIPKASNNPKPNMNVGAVFSYQDKMTKQKKEITLFFASKIDAIGYADIKGYSIEAVGPNVR